MNRFKKIAASNTLEFYERKKNIANQDLVSETIDYFKNGKGSRIFNELDALNIIYHQHKFVVENWENTDEVLKHLNALPVSDIEKHVILGMILKWFGGYPINISSETNAKVGETKKAIEKEFLKFEQQTPEKEFCKADKERRKKDMMYGIAMTTAINNNIPLQEVLKSLGYKPKKKIYYTFNSFFDDIINIEHHEKGYLVERAKYEMDFKSWILDEKEWEYGNEEQFSTFLNEETFYEFLEKQKNLTSKSSTISNSEQLYKHYLSTKRFLFQVFYKPYESKKFDEFSTRIYKYLDDYLFIYCKLDTNEAFAFKHDTIDHLNKIKGFQSAAKFTIVLDEIISRIDSISEVDRTEINKVNQSLANLSITEKLDYLSENEFNSKSLPKITTIGIPKIIFNHHFHDILNTPEATYWFLKHSATVLFDDYINSNEFKAKVESDLRTTLITADLKQLNESETKAKELLLNKQLDIYKEHPKNYLHNNEVSLLRVLDGNYYLNNPTNSIGNYTALEANYYFKHKLLKPFLEGLLNANDQIFVEDISKQKDKVLKLKNRFIPSQKTLELPYKFFSQLLTENNNAGEPYLDEKVLLLFLKRAFHELDNTNNKKLEFNIGFRENRKITYFFFQFMEWTSQYENGNQNNTKYLELLTANFIGFDFNRINNGNFKKKPAKPIQIISKY